MKFMSYGFKNKKKTSGWQKYNIIRTVKTNRSKFD